MWGWLRLTAQDACRTGLREPITCRSGDERLLVLAVAPEAEPERRLALDANQCSSTVSGEKVQLHSMVERVHVTGRRSSRPHVSSFEIATRVIGRARMGRVDGGSAKFISLQRPAQDAAPDVIGQVGRIRVCEAGKNLFTQGQVCQGLYIVETGLVGLRRTDDEGNTALVALALPGDMVGYRALLANDLHSNSAEVLTTSRIRFIDRGQMTYLIDQDADVRQHIVNKALVDLGRAQEKCAALLTEGLRSRFIRLLLSLKEAKGAGQKSSAFELCLPIQKKDIAALIGAAPASLSRLINELEEEGLIRVDGRKIEFSAAARAFGHGEFRSAMPEKSGHASVLRLLMEARQALLSMIDAEDPRVRDALNARVQAASAQIDSLLADLARGESAMRQALEFRRIWECFKQTRQMEIIPAIYAGRPCQARSIAVGIQAERLALMKNIMGQAGAISH